MEVRNGVVGRAFGRGRAAGLAGLLALLLAAPLAEARSFVTLVDTKGTIAKPSSAGPPAVEQYVVGLYEATGLPLPDVISVWTTFDMDKGSTETLFDPVENDVKGIGLESFYGGDGTFPSDHPPLRAILLHNNVTVLPARASIQGAPQQDFARYLFLLELSHVWGPAITIPGADGGASTTELEGALFHWSFWMDATGSPAGGNAWKDNGDGTFTVVPSTPTAIRYSMLDLYIMGLASASEVPPFGVLENAVPPQGMSDPFTHGPYSAASFPWWGPAPFTVPATRRTLTIDDVIAANGPRSPNASTSPKSWKLGIVLMTSPSDSASDVSAAEALFEPIAASLAPAFHDATSGRGTFELVTSSPDPADAGADDAGGDAGADDAGATPDAGAPPRRPNTPASGGGCDMAGDPASASAMFLPIAAWLAAWGFARRARNKKGSLRRARS